MELCTNCGEHRNDVKKRVVNGVERKVCGSCAGMLESTAPEKTDVYP